MKEGLRLFLPENKYVDDDSSIKSYASLYKINAVLHHFFVATNVALATTRCQYFISKDLH